MVESKTVVTRRRTIPVKPKDEEPEKRMEEVMAAEPDHPEEPTVRWRNIGGTHYLKYTDKKGRPRHKVIKMNQTFSAKPSEIKQAFRDKLVPVEKLPPEPKIEFVPGGYKLEPADEEGAFNIVNSQGKKINESSLTEEKANMILQSMKG